MCTQTSKIVINGLKVDDNTFNSLFEQGETFSCEGDDSSGSGDGGDGGPGGEEGGGGDHSFTFKATFTRQ